MVRTETFFNHTERRVMTHLKQKMSKMKAELTLVGLILTIGLTAEV